jgi:CDP-glucose 4,6-dehydratase
MGHRDPAGTYATNVLGTVHLLEALQDSPSTTAVVVVTSDKVYANAGRGKPFREEDPLGGSDPYSGSKVCAEMVVQAWRNSLAPSASMAVATARAGNVIGGGDVAPDRLLPDAWRAITTHTPLLVRYPEATRPWQFVLEPLLGYLLLAQQLALAPATTPHSLNFGPEVEGCRSVLEVVRRVFERLGTGSWEMEQVGQPAEASLLTLDSSRAREVLAWRGRLDFDQALEWTVQWWDRERRGGDLQELAATQVEAYETLSSP